MCNLDTWSQKQFPYQANKHWPPMTVKSSFIADYYYILLPQEPSRGLRRRLGTFDFYSLSLWKGLWLKKKGTLYIVNRENWWSMARVDSASTSVNMDKVLSLSQPQCCSSSRFAARVGIGFILQSWCANWLNSQSSIPCIHCIYTCVYTYISIHINAHTHTHLYDGVSCIQGSAQIHYVAKSDLDFWPSCLYFLNAGATGVYYTWVMWYRGLSTELLACLASSLHPEPLPGYHKPSTSSCKKSQLAQHWLLFTGMLGHYLQQDSWNHSSSAGSSENANRRPEHLSLLS